MTFALAFSPASFRDVKIRDDGTLILTLDDDHLMTWMAQLDICRQQLVREVVAEKVQEAIEKVAPT